MMNINDKHKLLVVESQEDRATLQSTLALSLKLGFSPPPILISTPMMISTATTVLNFKDPFS